MKDNLFEMLLTLFESSLNRLQELADQEGQEQTEENALEQMPYFQSQQPQSIRVFTFDERVKLTKASYQFLVRMKLWSLLEEESFEKILHQLQMSDSRMVTLRETKWTIRQVLAPNLDEKQLAFLDLVLYQAEDELTMQ